MKTNWHKGIIHEVVDSRVNVSVVFTWDLPLARKLCAAFTGDGHDVRAGGPAVSLMSDYLKDVATIGGDMPFLSRFCEDADYTTRGCIRACAFCAVRKIEGSFREVLNWKPRWRPHFVGSRFEILCDNNFLAASRGHIEGVVDELTTFDGVDFNQGLDARLLNAWHVEQLRRLRLPVIRFSWDHASEEQPVMDAVKMLLAAGYARRNIQIYILVNNGETQAEAHYRFNTLKAAGIRGFPMRFQPLETLKKDSYVSEQWTDAELRRFCRYWARQNWFSKIPYVEFRG